MTSSENENQKSIGGDSQLLAPPEVIDHELDVETGLRDMNGSAYAPRSGYKIHGSTSLYGSVRKYYNDHIHSSDYVHVRSLESWGHANASSNGKL